MAKPFNLPTRAARTSEVGLLWRELLSGASGTLEIDKHTAFRVRAAAGLTVTVDGVLAATMVTDEVILFNTGAGMSEDDKDTVTVAVSGSCYLQVGEEIERYRP